jgi:hypothetical protein
MTARRLPVACASSYRQLTVAYASIFSAVANAVPISMQSSLPLAAVGRAIIQQTLHIMRAILMEKWPLPRPRGGITGMIADFISERTPIFGSNWGVILFTTYRRLRRLPAQVPGGEKGRGEEERQLKRCIN